MNRFITPIAAIAAAFAISAHAQLADNPDLRTRVETSVNRGLEYLAANLTPQGCYDSAQGRTSAIPALAGMAFLSAGHIPGEGPYGEKINLIIDYVLGCAQSISLGPIQNKAYFGGTDSGRMYAHSIATLFLSEVSGMVDPDRQAKIDELLPDAVRLILEAQAVVKNEMHAGGWRYEPNSGDSDMSCSGWALMALRSSRLNGAPVPDEAIDNAVKYVKRSFNESQGYFGYQNASGNGVTLTGAGILCLELCGRHNDEASRRAAVYMKDAYKQLEGQPRCFYGLYYTSQGLFQLGGETWSEFAAWMYDTWIPRQQKDGAWNRGEEGSLPYQTSLCILAFTVPYRQLPIYQRDETVDE